jgi:hypothetical protein
MTTKFQSSKIMTWRNGSPVNIRYSTKFKMYLANLKIKSNKSTQLAANSYIYVTSTLA